MLANVRFASLADIGATVSDVRFTPKSGHWSIGFECLLLAKSGHWRRFRSNLESAPRCRQVGAISCINSGYPTDL